MIVRPIILAAGVGQRMHSSLPKVLHRVCGRPMIRYVLDAAAEASLDRPVVVVGRDADAVRAEAGGYGATFVEQPEQRGTGDAVRVGLGAVGEGEAVLVLYGADPLVTGRTLRQLITHHQRERPAMTILTARVQHPRGYGRIVRNPDGGIARIAEEVDASPQERRLDEINTGTYLFEGGVLREGLRHLKPTNVKGEYYLTDVIAWAVAAGQRVAAVLTEDPGEALGVNSRAELAQVEAVMRARLLDILMDSGVMVIDPQTTYVHAGVTVGPETVIHPGCFLEGSTTVGRGCAIGPNARLVDATIGDRVTVLSSTVVQSSMGEGSRIGPYSHLRPGTRVGRGVEIGNFAEMKNSTVGDLSKVHHKSYLGDATLGERVNIGAGTVTCNLRDRTGKKWPTIIEDDAFIGSDSMLVAPVRIGRGATTGAGSVVTKDVPAGAVVVGVPARVIRREGSRAAPRGGSRTVAATIVTDGRRAGKAVAPRGAAGGRRLRKIQTRTGRRR
ncbi:MAG: bifunctional UDP-N-acetylglucosamine diphosphorylase/glucosamine-1-phosphate N-acetyltransferase GlmU [bacterium]